MTFNEFKLAVTSNNYSAPSSTQHANFNKFAKSIGRITTKQEAAMALAQFIYQSRGLREKRELICLKNQCKGHYKISTCDVPGNYYYGRGYLRLSWCHKYRAASKALFNDDRLVKKPDQVATDDEVSWKTTFWLWARRVHTRVGVSQGKFGATTRALNGWECSPGNPKPKIRYHIYMNVRKALGLPGHGSPAGC